MILVLTDDNMSKSEYQLPLKAELRQMELDAEAMVDCHLSGLVNAWQMLKRLKNGHKKSVDVFPIGLVKRLDRFEREFRKEKRVAK